MLKHTASQKNLFLEKRLVFIMMGGGEASHGPDKGGEQKEGAKKAPEQGDTDLVDPAKRKEVYAKVEAKAQELLASDDPHKQKRGEMLKKQLDQAKSDEAKFDTSMAITMAFQLRDHLDSISRGEELAAARAKKKESKMASADAPKAAPAAAAPAATKAAPKKPDKSYAAELAALDAAQKQADADAARLAAMPSAPKVALPPTPAFGEAAPAAEPPKKAEAPKQPAAEKAPPAPKVAMAAPPAAPASAPSAPKKKPDKAYDAEMAALAALESQAAKDAARLAAMPSAPKVALPPTPVFGDVVPAAEAPKQPAAEKAPPAPKVAMAPPAAPAAAPKGAPKKPDTALASPLAGLAGLQGLSPSAGPKAEGDESDKPKRHEVMDVKRLPPDVKKAYEDYSKSKDTGPRVVQYEGDRYTFERYVKQQLGATFSKVKIYREKAA